MRGLIQLARENDEVLDYVLTLKGDGSVPFRHKWARLLSEFDSPRVAQAFIESLEQEENPHVAKTLIKGLAKSGDKSFVLLLRPFLEHESHAIRHAAKMTIAELEYEEVPEDEPEEEPPPVTSPVHRLPWRLKLKFFYRKYKSAFYILLFAAALYPLSLGVNYSVGAVKDLIASYQPSAEELAERERLEKERLRLEALEKERLQEEERLRREELERLKELERELKPETEEAVNWGRYLSLIISILVFISGASVSDRVFTGLKKRFKNEPPGSPEALKSELSPREELTENLKEGCNEKKGQSLEKEKEPADETLNSEPEKAEKEAIEKEEVQVQKGSSSEHSQSDQEERVISQSKKILFSMLDRLFNLFNFKSSKGLLKIAIPDELFYKIRFKVMLSCLTSVFLWFVLAVVAFYLFAFLSKSQLDLYQVEIIINTMGGIASLVASGAGFYGFFTASPFKRKDLNLHKQLSDYYNLKESSLREEEQEQWGILLRHLEKNRQARMSIVEFLIFSLFMIPVLMASLYFIFLPLVKRFSPDLNLKLPMFDWGVFGSHLNAYNWSGFDLILAAILILPFMVILLSSLLARPDEKQKAQEVRRAEKDSLLQKQELINIFSSMSFSNELRVICGENKKEWFESVCEDFQSEFHSSFISVEYLKDEEAQRSVEKGHAHVWMPDSELAAKKMMPSFDMIDADYLLNEGTVIQTPLVYVFRKSVLKSFMDIYRCIDYRSFIDANSRLRNLTDVSFSFVYPDFDDYDKGTYNLILLINEYFRTTSSYQGDVYKNTIFQRTLREYLNSRAASLDKNKSSVFVTSEREGIKFLEQKKGRGWQLVYPSMIVQMPQKYFILEHSPEAIFFYKYLMSGGVQKKAGSFGWRPGISFESMPNEKPMEKWAAFNVPHRLGVHTNVPEMNVVRDMVAIANSAFGNKKF